MRGERTETGADAARGPRCRAQFMNYWFRVKVLRVPGSQAVYKGGPCMFLVGGRRPRPPACRAAAWD